ncbi:MAG: hypothetical protein Q7R76_02140 [Candidatus Woesearchaeota archaeon]|nr:hypothetical protein [Candidatus Woesearchaeota archaeon]
MSSKNGIFHRAGILFPRSLLSYQSCRSYASFFIALLLIGVTILAALGLPASALREDFLALSQQKTLPVCGCSIRTNTVTVKNTGDITSVYELSQAGDAASWSTLTETRFSLKPGQVQDVAQFVRAPCSAEGASKNTITISTLFQTSKKIEQDFTVPVCNNIVVVPVRNSAVSCPAQPTQFSFMLANPLSYPEVYDVSVAPTTVSLTNGDAVLASKAISISEHSILLAPQQKKKILLFLQLPSTVYGDAAFALTVSTRNSGLQTTIPFRAVINQCYDFQLSLPASIKFCTEFENRLPLQLANTANIRNEYQLTAGIMTPEGASQEEYDLGAYALPGKVRQQVSTDLLVESEPGDYVLGVEATPTLGDLAKYAESPLEITYCDDNGKSLTPEEYDALQTVLEQPEPQPADETEAGTTEPTDTTDGTTEENPVSTAFVAFPIILVVIVLLLGIIAARKRKKLFLPATVPTYAHLIRAHAPTKKRKALIISVLAIVFVLLLLIGLLLVNSLSPPAESDESGNFTEELPVEEIEEPAPAEQPEEQLNVSTISEDETGEQPATSPLISILFILLIAFIGLLLVVLAYKIKKRRARLAIYNLGSSKGVSDKPFVLRTNILDVKDKAEKALRTPRKMKLLKWLGALFLVALLVLGGIGLATMLKSSHQNSIVSIDDSFAERAAALGVTFSGATIRIPAGGKEVTIPLVFRNIDDGTPRTVNMDFGIDWLKPSSTSVLLKPGREKTADLTIQSTAPTGSYTILFEVTNDKGELFAADELNLDIVGKNAWLPAAIGIIVGVLIIIVLLVIRKLKKKKPTTQIIGDETSMIETVAHHKLREAAEREAAAESVRRAALKEEKRAARRKKIKKTGISVGVLLLVALLTLGVFTLSRNYMITFNPSSAAPVEISAEEPVEYTLNVTGLTSVPIKILNKNKNIVYNITAESSEDWITFDLRSVVVEPQDSETITMLLAPHGGVKDGTYKLNLKIEEQTARADRELFNNTILVKLTKRGFIGRLLAYWLYLVFGIVILFGILFLITSEVRKRHKALLQQLAVEVKQKINVATPKQTTKQIASKQKKSKYALPPTRLKLKE